MFILIKNYMNNLTREQVNQFATSNNTNLSDSELEFTYLFIKKNWEAILQNPNSLNIEKYRSHYSPENFAKIEQLLPHYFNKYKNYL